MVRCEYCGEPLKHYIGADRKLRCACCLTPKQTSVSSPDAAAEYQRSEHLRHLGRIAEAYDACRLSSDGGNYSAAINLGYYYEYGLSSNGAVICERDVKAAFYQYLSVAKLNASVAELFGIEKINVRCDGDILACAVRNLACVMANNRDGFYDTAAQYPALYADRTLPDAVDYCIKGLLEIYFTAYGTDHAAEDIPLKKLLEELSSRSFEKNTSETAEFPQNGGFLIYFCKQRLNEYPADCYTEGGILNNSLSMGVLTGVIPSKWAYIDNRLANAFNTSKTDEFTTALNLGIKRKKDSYLLSMTVTFKPLIQKFNEIFIGSEAAAVFTENEIRIALTDAALAAISKKAEKNPRFLDREKDLEETAKQAIAEFLAPLLPRGKNVAVKVTKGESVKR